MGLDPIDERRQLVHLGRAEQGAAEPVERMRDPDEPALCPDVLDRLERVEAAPDRSLQEDPDQVALTRPDLLADEDRQRQRLADRHLASLEGAIDPVVVRDRKVRQAATRRRSDDGPRRGQRIKRRRCVAVEIDEGATATPGGVHRAIRPARRGTS